MTSVVDRPASTSGPARFRPEPAPRVAWPSLALFTGTFAVWAAGLWATLSGHLPWPAVIALDTACAFVMFTIVHDATHHALGSSTRLNSAFGRAAMLWFAGYAGFGLFKWIHIEHHRNTNEGIATDPDSWAEEGPSLQLPLRWASLDGRYFYLWVRARRPRAERLETAVTLACFAATIVATALTGTFWWFLIIFLIPQRISLIILVWWFDWLPHHGLKATQREDRYRATRIRAGWEPFLTTMLLYQNYHLVHHLHPSVPFYRYLKTWRAGLADFLAHNPPVMKVWGDDMTVDEYRAWRGIREQLEGPDGPAPRRSHRLTVRTVDRLTADAVAVTLAVPADLADTFAFQAGQHVTVAAPEARIEGRRTYSLCLPPPEAGAAVDTLRIGVKQLQGGVFSTWAATELAPGHALEVAPPTGRFAPDLLPTDSGHHVLVAAGSGITPVLSVLASVLAAQPGSRCTLLYGNRTAGSTMFAPELAELAARHGSRLAIHHFRTGPDPTPPADGGHLHEGRIDAAGLGAVLAADGVDAGAVDHWYVCGPRGLIDAVVGDLTGRGVDGERVHRELFHVDRQHPARPGRPELTATVTVTHNGGQLTYYLPSEGESILDAGLRELPDLPYSCIAGACGTCRAKLCSGTVDMETDAALSAAEKDAGFILTCQSHPTSEEVVIDYDARPAPVARTGRRAVTFT